MTAEFIVALHAIEFLNHRKQALSSETIAENVCTNPARVRKVLHKLKAAGLVASKSGADGGYAFTRDAGTVTLLDIFDAVGSGFIKVSWRSGNAEMDCPIAAGMAPVMDDVFAGLDSCCRASLSAVTVADVDARLFPPDGVEGKGAET